MTEHYRLATLAEVEHGLPGVLTRLLADPAWWIAILRVNRSRNRYLQFVCHDDGKLWAEATSNVNLEGDDTLTVADETRLVELGWSPPEPPGRPNFYMSNADEVDVGAAARRAMTTLREVFGVEDSDRLTIKLFKSPMWQASGEGNSSLARLASEVVQ
jgi:hypothetical protein